MKRTLIIICVFALLFSLLCAAGCYCNCLGTEVEQGLGGLCGCLKPVPFSLTDDHYIIDYGDASLYVTGNGEKAQLDFTITPASGITITALEIYIVSESTVVGEYMYEGAISSSKEISLAVDISFYQDGELSFFINGGTALEK